MAGSNRLEIEIAATTTGDKELDALLQTMRSAGADIAPFEQAARKLGQELDALKQQQGLVTAFADLKTQTSSAAQEMASAQQKAQQLGQELSQLDAPTKKQTAEFDRARKAVIDAKDAYQDSALKLQDLRAKLAESGIETDKLAAHQIALRQRSKEAGEAITGMKTSLQALSQEGQATTSATQAMEAAFRQLGVQSIKTVEAEVRKLQAALAVLKNSTDIAPEDKKAAVAAFNAELAKLRTSATQVKPALDSVGAAGNTAASGLGEAAHKAAAWVGAVAGFSQLKAVVANVVETGAAFETLQARLSGLLGSTQAATGAMDMIKELATTTPFEVQALADSFAKLTAFGLQPTREQMVALSDTVASLGGGTEALSGVTLALGQAWTKGKLQGDEIMQLAERGVAVWDALARATGRSVPELQRMSEAGTLGRDAIKALIDEMGRMNQGASDKLMNTYAGAVSNARDALAQFFDMIASSGALDFLTNNLKAALVEFERMKETGELAATAKSISDGFVTTATAIKSAAQAFVTLYPAIEAAAKVAAALKAIDIARSLYGMATGARAAAAGLTAVGAQGAVAAAGMTTAAAGMTTAAVAADRLAVGIRLLRTLTGVGLAIGVAELVTEFFRAKSAAEAGDAAVKKMMQEPPVNGPKKAATEATTAIDGMGIAADRAAQDMRMAFEKMVAEGQKVDEALNAVGKDFDLSKSPGIVNAAQVLDGLLVDGKITADQFNKAWTDALKGVDLADFEARARQAFDGSNEGALRLKGVLDVGLREAIMRSGADFDVLAGGMSKASISATNDTQTIINGLDRLKARGVDTAAALTASIGRGIDTANTQKALDAVRSQIEQVRKVLGDKVADGLLDQARQKAYELKAALDRATPGVDTLAEALKELGITSDAALKQAAADSLKLYEAVRQTGGSAREAREAFRKYAEDAIAANGGVATEAIKVQAAMNGLRIDTDATGKSIVTSMNSGRDAAAGVGAAAQVSAERMRELANAVDLINTKYTASWKLSENQIALLDKELDKQQQLLDLKQKAIDLENKRRGVDAEGFSVNRATGQRITESVDTVDSITQQLIAGGMSPGAAREAAVGINNRKMVWSGLLGGISGGEGSKTTQQMIQDQLAAVPVGGRTATDSRTGTQGPTPATTTAKTYNVQIGNRTIRTSSDADAQALIGALKDARLSA